MVDRQLLFDYAPLVQRVFNLVEPHRAFIEPALEIFNRAYRRGAVGLSAAIFLSGSKRIFAAIPYAYAG